MASSLTQSSFMQSLLLLSCVGLMMTTVLGDGGGVAPTPATAAPGDDQSSFVKDMLSGHNAVRQSLGIGPLTWNATVAAYAENYAKQRSADCQLIHSHGPYGENIYWGFGDGAEKAAPAVNWWVDEKKDYDYATNTCASGKQCAHYTQIVWKKTQQLGCAHVRCSSSEGYFTGCNYYPPGNYIGEKPY